MSIAGKQVRAERTIEVRNPATGETFASAPDRSRRQLDDAMRAARDAYPSWRADEATRRASLKRIAAILTENADDLARLLVTEQGKPLPDTLREITTAALWFSYYADLEIPVETIQDDERAKVVVLRRPIGVVAAITPWNYPVVQASWKLALTLLAGNTVVLKSSPYTPLTNLRMGNGLIEGVRIGPINNRAPARTGCRAGRGREDERCADRGGWLAGRRRVLLPADNPGRRQRRRAHRRRGAVERGSRPCRRRRCRPRVRNGLDQHTPSVRTTPAVRGTQMEWVGNREWSLGPARIHRPTGRIPYEVNPLRYWR
jgi:hypothetical protein